MSGVGNAVVLSWMPGRTADQRVERCGTPRPGHPARYAPTRRTRHGDIPHAVARPVEGCRALCGVVAGPTVRHPPHREWPGMLSGVFTGNVRPGKPSEPVSVAPGGLSSRPAHATRCHSAGRSPFPRKRSAMWGFVCGPHRAPPYSRVRFESLQRLGSLTPPGPAEGGPERFAVGGLFAEASSRLRLHRQKWISGGTRCCSGLRPRTTRPVRCVPGRGGRTPRRGLSWMINGSMAVSGDRPASRVGSTAPGGRGKSVPSQISPQRDRDKAHTVLDHLILDRLTFVSPRTPDLSRRTLRGRTRPIPRGVRRGPRGQPRRRRPGRGSRAPRRRDRPRSSMGIGCR